MKKVVIFGTGAHGRVMYPYLSQEGHYEVVAFTVHESYLGDETFQGLDVVPFERIEEIYPPERFAMFVALGFTRVNKDRAQVYSECKRKGYELITYVHSSVIRCGTIDIGENCAIGESAVIQPFAQIGNDVTIGSGSIIGHDASIGDHCFISAGVAITGEVKIGPYCFIGANATIKQRTIVAAECIIGAGALVLHDTKERGVYVPKGTEAASTTSDVLSSFFGTG